MNKRQRKKARKKYLSMFGNKEGRELIRKALLAADENIPKGAIPKEDISENFPFNKDICDSISNAMPDWLRSDCESKEITFNRIEEK